MVAFLAAVACAPAAPTPSGPASSVASPATPTAVAATPPATPTPTRQLTVETVVTGLNTPWAIDFAPDGRWFVTERGGQVRVIQNGQLRPEPWATFPVAAVGEAGLLGLALDPQFAQNRFVYVAYTYRDSNRLLNRLVRLRDVNGRGEVDRVLVDNVPGNTTHDGGRVRFGPDGKLYWAMGDATTNPQTAQDRATLNGKILRLNPDGTIPADNPFPNSPVFALGLRNPQGLAWQPGTNLLFSTDHGPSGPQGCCRDELNLIEPGKNYGWPVITGSQTRDGMVAPILHSGDSVTWAPAGMTFVTRGPWQGSLLFTALRGEALYRVTLDRADPSRVLAVEPVLQQQFGRLRDVVEGPDGALYVLTSNRDGRGRPAADDDRILRLTFR
ncbi:MAG: PQQ-dependent sugar dehydrogenase [Dehalococcoidia bacterium]|nr:PQQ-dependent sugar dehydrogenase [Dehalococcoidia bacterium]